MCGIKKVGDGGKRIASQWWNDETKQVAEKKKALILCRREISSHGKSTGYSFIKELVRDGERTFYNTIPYHRKINNFV